MWPNKDILLKKFAYWFHSLNASFGNKANIKMTHFDIPVDAGIINILLRKEKVIKMVLGKIEENLSFGQRRHIKTVYSFCTVCSNEIKNNCKIWKTKISETLAFGVVSASNLYRTI